MLNLVRDFVDSKLTRRGFVAAMVSAGYSAVAARSAPALTFLPMISSRSRGWVRTHGKRCSGHPHADAFAHQYPLTP